MKSEREKEEEGKKERKRGEREREERGRERRKSERERERERERKKKKRRSEIAALLFWLTRLQFLILCHEAMVKTRTLSIRLLRKRRACSETMKTKNVFVPPTNCQQNGPFKFKPPKNTFLFLKN